MLIALVRCKPIRLGSVIKTQHFCRLSFFPLTAHRSPLRYALGRFTDECLLTRPRSKCRQVAGEMGALHSVVRSTSRKAALPAATEARADRFSCRPPAA